MRQVEPETVEGLKRLLSYEHEKMIVTIPEIFSDLSIYRKESRQFWKDHLLFSRKTYEKYCNPAQKYYNTSVSRFYYALEDKGQCGKWAEDIRQIWNDKDVVVVEGERTHNGVGNDLLDTAKSIERIIGPSAQAYAKVDEILSSLPKNIQRQIISGLSWCCRQISGGEAFLEGYRALDIGNLDMEYEWYLHQAKGKEKLAKHDIVGEEANREAGYDAYLAQIRKRISL